MARFYKGDIVHEKEDLRGNKAEWLVAINLFGILCNIDSAHHLTLFHRPLKNKIKNLFHKLFPIKIKKSII